MATASAAVVALGTGLVAQHAQAYSLFSERTSFQNELDTLVVDDYENPAYLNGDVINGSTVDIHSDAQMSSILGETQYNTTGWNNWNLIVEQNFGHKYCAGCNGSFLLDFTQTTVGNSLGVFGAGFDIFAGTNYFAHVILGDDSTQDFSLASSGQGFWGITSEKSIKGIHIGLANGGSTTNGYIEIDNLTIGSKSVPEPTSAIGLLGLGAIGAASMLKRKQQQKATAKA
ncbi:PEP-CTERM sorting domain-containing protein [Argonema galeatum]|uniref:PEP-CTERM sorting domain-containing protein n=1 Tax=Argonema galeatum TaxID=2942762 RepID=UPI0020117CE3|nr:PEP-CTERM sorting domain-containing protein [Argonema galeatum]MCL1465217.1 PEP-CTERM sorting domain-containing protein [Argonema galeatum A003/A1]